MDLESNNRESLELNSSSTKDLVDDPESIDVKNSKNRKLHQEALREKR